MPSKTSAKSPSRVRIAAPNKGKRKASDKTRYFRVFTDGGCSGNGKSWAKAGLGVHFPKNQHPDISLPFISPPITNQRAELAAILVALKTVLSKKLLSDYDELVIYSDSEYSIKCITLWAPNWEKNGWKRAGYKDKGEPLKNLDLIREIYELLPKLPIPLVFVHVMAHTDDDDYRSRHNAIADELASEGVRMSKSKDVKQGGKGNNNKYKGAKPAGAQYKNNKKTGAVGNRKNTRKKTTVPFRSGRRKRQN